MSEPTEVNNDASSVVEIKPNRSRIAENDEGINQVPTKFAKITDVIHKPELTNNDNVEVVNKEPSTTTNGNFHISAEINQETEVIETQEEEEEYEEDENEEEELNELNDSNINDLTEESSTDMDEYIHANLSVIEDCQSHIDRLNQEANEEILKVEHKYNKLRSPIYKRRDEFILKIPNFWLSVFSRHPQLKRVMTKDDLKCLVHLKSLQIEDFEEKRSGYSIKFYFEENPYFYNDVITKEYHLPWHDAPSCECSVIRWKDGMDLTKLENTSSFFSWFCPQEDASTDDIAEIIKDELWPNPLQCYLMNKDGESESEESEEEEEGEVYINEDSAEYISSDDGEGWQTSAQGKDGPSKEEFYVIDDDEEDLEDGGILSDDDEVVVDKTEDYVDLRHNDQLRHQDDEDELVDLEATDDVIENDDDDDDVIYSDDVIDSDAGVEVAEKLPDAADERLSRDNDVTEISNDVTSTSEVDSTSRDQILSNPEASSKEISQESETTLSPSPT